MLLSKIPVLDKGWIALSDTSNDGAMLQDIQNTYLKTHTSLDLLDIATATFIVKCPLFMQLNLMKHIPKVIGLPEEQTEAYIPDVSEISTGNTDDDIRLHHYFKETTESLLMNSKALPADKCDKFLAQTLTPISVYNRLIVHGSLRQWLGFLKQKRLPKLVDKYREAIRNELKAKWRNVDSLISIV